ELQHVAARAHERTPVLRRVLVRRAGVVRTRVLLVRDAVVILIGIGAPVRVRIVGARAGLVLARVLGVGNAVAVLVTDDGAPVRLRVVALHAGLVGAGVDRVGDAVLVLVGRTAVGERIVGDGHAGHV